MSQIKFGIYLTSEGTTIRFPVNFQELPIEYPSANEHYNALAIGEVIQPRLPGLATFSWNDGLLPGRPDASYVLTSGAFEPPEFYINFINNCKKSRLVCTLTIDRYYEDGTPYHSDTCPVIVEDFKATERGGETGDFYYDITLTEYRDFSPRSVTFNKTSNGTTTKTTAAVQKARTVAKNQLVVGKKVKVNGKFYYSSYGTEPHGNGNGRTAVVSRIITGTRAYPILLKTEAGGLLGWCKKDAVTVT